VRICKSQRERERERERAINMVKNPFNICSRSQCTIIISMIVTTNDGLHFWFGCGSPIKTIFEVALHHIKVVTCVLCLCECIWRPSVLRKEIVILQKREHMRWISISFNEICHAKFVLICNELFVQSFFANLSTQRRKFLALIITLCKWVQVGYN
jgi:hypothetical protein